MKVLTQVAAPDVKTEKFLRRLLGNQDYDANVTKLAQMAFDEMVDWLQGGHRPATVAELTYERVTKLYGEILGSYPTVESLVDKLNMPVTRARPIASTIKYDQYPKFKRYIWNSILGKLDKPRTTSPGYIQVMLSDAERQELDPIVEEVSGDPNFAPLNPMKQRFGRLRLYEINKKSRDIIVAKIEEKVGELGEVG